MKKLFYLVLIVFLVGCDFNFEEIPEGDTPNGEISDGVPSAPSSENSLLGEETAASESPQDNSPLADAGITEAGSNEPSLSDPQSRASDLGIDPSDVSGEVDCPPDESDILHPWEIRLCNFIERRKQ